MSFAGKYELLEELGSGPMSAVYRALDTRLDREVALKTLRNRGAAQSDMIERFHREAKACAHLRHSTVVTIYDFGEADGVAFMAMELLQGDNLRRLIASNAPVAPAVKMEVLAQVCEGLAEAHRAGILHRDVKPSNVFMTRDGHARILDFGVARVPDSKLTVVGGVLGTPNYMAPEQILGKTCGSSADLFSAAVVLFEFLTGVHPFQAESVPRRIVTGPPAPLREIDSSFPVAAEILLLKALAGNPEARFQTGDELASEIRAAARGMEVRSVSVGMASPPGEETSEWRVAEFMRLLQECDDAVEDRKPEIARQSLAGMRELAAADARFAVAVQEYQTRLSAIESPPEPLLWEPVPREPLITAPAEASAPELSVPEPSAPERSPVELPEPVPWQFQGNVVPAVPLLAAPFSRLRRVGMAMIPAIGVTALVMFAAPLFRPSVSGKQAPLAPAIGTARVRSAVSLIYPGPMGRGTPIVSLHAGDPINILGGAGPDTTWVRVQYATGKTLTAAGYMNSRDLENWSALPTLRAVQPGDGAEDTWRLEYIRQLKQYLAQRPTAADASQARLEIAAQEKALASQGAAPAPAPALAPASIAASVAGGNSPPVYDPALDYRRAVRAWQTGDYARAQRALGRLLKAEPDNVQAKDLSDKVAKAQAIDPGISQ